MKAAPACVNPVAGPRARRHLDEMAEKDKERDERLAAALRENLRRRKTQARELGAEKKNEG